MAEATQPFVIEVDTAQGAKPVDPYDDSKEKFVSLIKNFRANSLDNINQRIVDQNVQYEDYVRRAREQQWELNDLKREKEQIEKSDEIKVDQLNSQFDALLRHNKVDGLGIRDTELLVKTVELMMKHPETGEEKKLGQFEITLPLTAGRATYLSILNRTNAKEYDGSVWQHPHVEGERPCLGSIEADVFDSLSRGELPATLELLLQYLQTFNPNDSLGKNWDLW